VFLVVKCDNTTYDYLIYASNLLNEVKVFLRDVKKAQNDAVTMDPKELKHQIKGIIKVISMLKNFVTGQVMLSKADKNTGNALPVWKNKAMVAAKDQKKDKNVVTEKLPIKRRQKLLKDLGVFEILFGIIQHYWLIYKMHWVI
jgi:hypothetical protein